MTRLVVMDTHESFETNHDNEDKYIIGSLCFPSKQVITIDNHQGSWYQTTLQSSQSVSETVLSREQNILVRRRAKDLGLRLKLLTISSLVEPLLLHAMMMLMIGGRRWKACLGW